VRVEGQLNQTRSLTSWTHTHRREWQCLRGVVACEEHISSSPLTALNVSVKPGRNGGMCTALPSAFRAAIKLNIAHTRGGNKSFLMADVMQTWNLRRWTADLLITGRNCSHALTFSHTFKTSDSDHLIKTNQQQNTHSKQHWVTLIYPNPGLSLLGNFCFVFWCFLDMHCTRFWKTTII